LSLFLRLFLPLTVSGEKSARVVALLVALDDARALAQLDQLVRVPARGFTVGAAGDQQIDRAGTSSVPLLCNTLNGSSSIIGAGCPSPILMSPRLERIFGQRRQARKAPIEFGLG
jgi:hypothetical protein